MNEKRDHLSVVDRYYTRKYKTDILGNPMHDQCMLLHSNRVCVVTVAKSHPILADGKSVTAVDYRVGGGVDRMDNKVSGKGKKGAQKLKPDSPLCTVRCSDGTSFPFVSGVKGMLLEVNENLVRSPQLITQKSETDGYLAIILPPKNEYAKVVSKLDSEECYLRTLEKRKRQGNAVDASVDGSVGVTGVSGDELGDTQPRSSSSDDPG